MKTEETYKILGLADRTKNIKVEEVYNILRLVVGKFLERNQFTYVTAESRWRNLMLSIFCPSILMSAGQLVQEMHEISLLLHRLEERLENGKDEKKD